MEVVVVWKEIDIIADRTNKVLGTVHDYDILEEVSITKAITLLMTAFTCLSVDFKTI
jgi:hypothetical protein